MHVAYGIDMDDEGDPETTSIMTRDRGPPEADVCLELAGEDPGIDDFFHRTAGHGQLQEGREDQEGNEERKADGRAGNETHRPPGYPPAEEEIDGEPDGRKQRDQTHIVQHSTLSCDSLFVIRYSLHVIRNSLLVLNPGLLLFILFTNNE
jgi:hypothetical protein